MRTNIQIRGGQLLNKKAFTLIELLAVMVILAILAVVAIPIVIKIIDDAAEESNKRSIDLYANAVENAILTYKFNLKQPIIGTYESNEDGTVLTEVTTSSNKKELNVEYDGDVVCNTIKFYEDGTFYLANCYVDDMLVEEYSYGESIYYIDSMGVEVEPLTGLTPVIYDGTNWVVANVKEKWFDYKNQEWANAVILNDGVSSDIGTELNVETDVKTMFVYIPRYEYKIEGEYGKGGTSLSNPGEIEINFITKGKTTASTGYTVHPAFTFGNEELEGIWVGKFETSHSNQTTSTTSLNCTDEYCTNSDNLRILPNVVSLRNNTVSNFFYGIISMSRVGNGFGIEDDTHMMKNSEWGAVAYLSQSKYGKYGNSNYKTTKEIYQNKSSEYITGSSNGTPSTTTYSASQCTYDETNDNCGVGASTTGNITGVYDMSGGANEYVMGNYNNVLGGSGFSSLPDSKYYDTYTIYETNDIGHALSETSDSGSGQVSWYNDRSLFVSSGGSWFNRGGRQGDGSYAGVFNFSNNTGEVYVHYSARVVLVESK